MMEKLAAETPRTEMNNAPPARQPESLKKGERGEKRREKGEGRKISVNSYEV